MSEGARGSAGYLRMSQVDKVGRKFGIVNVNSKVDKGKKVDKVEKVGVRLQT